MLAKTGGLVVKDAAGPRVYLVNVQSRITQTSLSSIVQDMGQQSRMGVVLSEREDKRSAASAIVAALKGTNVASIIILVDRPGEPMLLVVPEERWAVINVAALEGSGATLEVLNARVQKEVWRAFGYLMGVANSNFPGCVMRTVNKPEDLDHLKMNKLSPEPLMKIMSQASQMGITLSRFTSYRKACEDGWAPAPTNEIQQAIWKEVKAK
jgi:predicted Zn-dependent protease